MSNRKPSYKELRDELTVVEKRLVAISDENDALKRQAVEQVAHRQRVQDWVDLSAFVNQVKGINLPDNLVLCGAVVSPLGNVTATTMNVGFLKNIAAIVQRVGTESRVADRTEKV